MGFLALAVLVVVALVVAAGVHTGPHGLLTAGIIGIVASIGFIVGIIALAPAGTRTSVDWALLSTAGAVSLAAVVGGASAWPALRRHQPSFGENRLWGAEGVVLTELAPVGTVRVRGETWSAESLGGTLPAGARVHVMEVEGLRLRVCPDVMTVPKIDEGAQSAGALGEERRWSR